MTAYARRLVHRRIRAADYALWHAWWHGRRDLNSISFAVQCEALIGGKRWAAALYRAYIRNEKAHQRIGRPNTFPWRKRSR